MRIYNYDEEHFEDRHNFICLMSYFHMAFSTQCDQVKMNIFVVLPVNKHPDYEVIMNTNAVLRLNSMQNSEASKGDISEN